MDMIKQAIVEWLREILVGGIESLQRVIVLLWLADQIELGEGTVKQGHGGGGSG